MSENGVAVRWECPSCLGVDECRHIPVPSRWEAWDGSFALVFDAAGGFTLTATRPSGAGMQQGEGEAQ